MYNYIIDKIIIQKIDINYLKQIKMEIDSIKCVSLYLYGNIKNHTEIRGTISKV